VLKKVHCFFYYVIIKEDNDIVVDLKCNSDAFFYWIMQYGKYTEVLEPQNMRERIKKAALDVLNKYK